MVERVYVLNLPHRLDRKYFMMGHLETIGLHKDDVDFFPAQFGLDYASSDEIIAAAVADGFPNFEKWDNRLKRITIAYNWNWCAMLRKVIESDSVVLILLDDRMLKITWEMLCNNVRFLSENYSPFHILQMGWARTLTHDYLYKPGEVINGFIAKGFGGFGDWGTVISPAGAVRLMEPIHNNRERGEGLFFKWSQADYAEKKGLFHFIYPQIDGTYIQWGEDIKDNWEKYE